MSSNGWKMKKLSTLCSKIGSGATPKGGKESYLSEGEIALIRSQNVLDFSFSYDGLAYINEEQAKKLNNVVVEEEDVLLNITGDSVARVCQVPKHLLPARVNQHVAIIRPKKELLDNGYLKYYLLNPGFKSFMLGLSTVGGTRNALTKGMIEDFEIAIPDLATQQKIASILSSLDDKIELNRQTNATLEAIAQALFKEWFVNFNYPGATGELVESELGMIPEGWKVVFFTSELNVVYGKNLPTTQLQSSGFPVFGGNGQIGYYSKYLYKTPQVTIACRGAASGKVNQTLPNSFVTNNSLVLEIPSTSKLNFSFLKYYCLNSDFVQFVSGSAQPQLTIDGLRNAKVLLPTEDVLSAFDIIVGSLEKKILENNFQNETLTQLRDSLLPRLMKEEFKLQL